MTRVYFVAKNVLCTRVVSDRPSWCSGLVRMQTSAPVVYAPGHCTRPLYTHQATAPVLCIRTRPLHPSFVYRRSRPLYTHQATAPVLCIQAQSSFVYAPGHCTRPLHTGAVVLCIRTRPLHPSFAYRRSRPLYTHQATAPVLCIQAQSSFVYRRSRPLHTGAVVLCIQAQSSSDGSFFVYSTPPLFDCKQRHTVRCL